MRQFTDYEGGQNVLCVSRKGEGDPWYDGIIYIFIGKLFTQGYIFVYQNSYQSLASVPFLEY
jgi:hypothetical protein